MKRVIAMLSALSLSMAAVAAHAEETKDVAKEKPRSGDGCVFARIVNDFQVIDDRTLAVWAPSRKTPYVVELVHPVPGLRHEISLGFEDHNGDGQICAYGGDSIIVQHPFTDRISIARVQRVTTEDMKLRLAAAKEKKDKTREKTTMPEQADLKSDKGAAADKEQPQEEAKEQPKN